MRRGRRILACTLTRSSGSNLLRDFDRMAFVRERPRLIEAVIPLPCRSRARRPVRAPGSRTTRRATPRLAEKCHRVPFCATSGAHRPTTKAEIFLELAQGTDVAIWGCANEGELCYFSVAILPCSNVQKTRNDQPDRVKQSVRDNRQKADFVALSDRSLARSGWGTQEGRNSPGRKAQWKPHRNLRFRIFWPPAFLRSLCNPSGGSMRATKLVGSAKCWRAKFSAAHYGELPSRSGLKEARCLIHPSSSVNAPPYPPEHVSGIGAGTVSALSDRVRC